MNLKRKKTKTFKKEINLIYDIFPPEKIEKIARNISGIKKYKTKTRKILAFSWRIGLAAFLIIYFITGLGPVRFIKESIRALTQETKVVNFYSQDCSGDWQNPEKAKGEPEIGPEGSLNSFSELNSAIYQNGPHDLICRDFIAKEQEGNQKTTESPKESFSEILVPEEETINEEQGTSTEEIIEEATTGEETTSQIQEEKGGQSQETSSLEVNTSNEEEVPISFFGKLKKSLRDLKVFAQEEEQFESAKIKFSLAIGEKESDALIIEEEGVNIEPQATSSERETDATSSQESISFWSKVKNFFESSMVKAEGEKEENIFENEPLTNETATIETALSEAIFVQEAISSEIIDEQKEERIDEEEKEASILTEDLATTAIDYNSATTVTAEIMTDLDTRIVIWYSLDGEMWWRLDNISDYPLSNKSNNGYFEYEAPFLENWEDVKNLKIKIEGVVGGETNVTIYLDSVWVEAKYQTKPKEKLLEIPRLTADGKDIEFLHTDDNTDENLIIRTNRQIYTNLIEADVYISVANAGEETEFINLQAYFPVDQGEVNKIEKWKEKNWQPLLISKESLSKKQNLLDKTLTFLKIKKEKIPKNFKVKKSTAEGGYEILAGETQYFKMKINFPVGSKGEFYIEAIGDKEGYGLLDPWWSSSWSYRKKITIDNTKVIDDLIDFPMLYSTDSDPDLVSHAHPDGTDILFTDVNSTSQLPHEIEYYSSSTGELVAWIKTDLASSTDTELYMYYGNPEASDQQQITNVWDSNYVGVWHLSETSGTLYDSTANDNDGTNSGADATSTGKIDGAYDFNGASNGDYINITSTTSLQITEIITLEAWINPDVNNVNYQYFIGKAYANEYALYLNSAASLRFGRQNTAQDSNTAIAAQAWSYIAVIDNGSNFLFFVNGDSVATTSRITGVTASNYDLRIGWRGEGGTTRNFNGRIDEPRISNTVRSAAWVKTSYNNQSSPPAFYAVASEENVPVLPNLTQIHYRWRNDDGSEGDSWYSSYWLYRKKITIDNTKVEDDLTDFPVLVSTTSADLSSKAQPDGDDILFTLSDGATKLPHEIEKYASSTGELIAWVKTDLSSTTDTYLYMYYGNAEASDQQQATSVWDDNYVGVYHLNEASGVIYDSTQHENNGTSSGGITYGATGQIASALEFYGGTGKIDLGTPSEFDNSDITLEAWINTSNNFTADGRIVTIWTGATNIWALTIAATSPGTNHAGMTNTTASHISPMTNSTVNDGNWHYLAGLRSPESIYDNGALQSATFTDSWSFEANAKIGSRGTSHYFYGIIDEVRISNINRSVAWISTSYNTMNSPSEFMSFGDEENYGGATWKESEDATTSVDQNANIRLRLEISNEGGTSSGAVTYQIEYGQKETACEAISSWTAVPVSPSFEHWQMVDSTYLTDAASTTNFDGSLTDENTTFVAGQVKDTGNKTDGITLTNSQFTEIEYSIKATNNALAADYCFRLTDNGVFNNFTYAQYPEVSVNVLPDLTQIHYRWRNDDGGEGNPNWYNSSWSYRKKITINNTEVDDDLTDFPVLYSTDSDSDLASHAQSDGDDILFTSSNGTTKLSHEIEYYASSTGQIIAWIKTDLSSSTDNYLYMYYGNSGASNQEQATSVWSNNYAAVFHFASDGDLDDSLGNYSSSSFTNRNVTWIGPTSTMGWCAEYNDDDDTLLINNFTDLGSELTAEMWINRISGNPNNYTRLFCEGTTYNASDWSTYTRDPAGGYTYMVNSTALTNSGTIFPSNEWVAYSVIYSDTNNEADMYCNASKCYDQSTAISKTDNYSQMYIIGDSGTGASTRGMVGYVDEVRFSTIQRSDAWLSTSYNNQSSPPAFYSLSAEYSSSSIGATWKESEDATTSVNQNDNIRLRLEISNEGGTSSSAVTYQIEYGQKETACEAISSWTAVPVSPSFEHWQMVDSTYLTDAASTTNFDGSLTDENTTFVAGQVKDTGNKTDGITLTNSQFTEIEYSIKATNNALAADYCFRLTDNGTTTYFTYSLYPQVTLSSVTGITVSGTSDLATGTVAIAVDDALQSATGSISGGVWSISNVSVASGSIVTVWIDGKDDADESTCIDKYDGEGDMTSLVLNKHVFSVNGIHNDRLYIRDFNQYNNDDDEDIMHNTSSVALNVDADNSYSDEKINILTNAWLQFNNGEILNTHDLEINGRLTAVQAPIFNISGSWDNNSNYDSFYETINFISTGTETIDSAGAIDYDLHNVVFNGVGGQWTISFAFVVDDIIMTEGTLTGSQDITVIEGGITGTNGIINLTGGTTTVSGTDNFGPTGAGTFDFYNLTFSSTTIGIGNFDVASILTISSGKSFNASGTTVTLTGSGTPFVISGTFTSASSTIKYTATDTTDITATTYYNLELAPSDSDSPTFTLAGETTTINGYLYIGDGTNPVTVTANANDPNLDINGDFNIKNNAVFTGSDSANFSIAGNWIDSGTFNHSDGTTTFDTAADRTISATSSAFYDLVFNGAGSWAFQGNTATASNDFIIVSGTVTSTDGTLGVGGSWSNSGTFNHNNGTVLFFSASGGETISDGGSAFYNLEFNGSGGEWLYADGANGINQTEVKAGTPTYLNTKTGTVSVTGGTLNVDWYLGAHVVDVNSSSTNIDTEESDISLSTASNWYNPSWSYRKKITIDHTKVDDDLIDFPVLISTTSGDLSSKAQPDGDDILFTLSDGKTKIPHEIEYYASTTGELVAWVKTDLSSSTDTNIYIYYGNSETSDQQSANGVWSNSFAAVWHMKESPTLKTNDSTINNNQASSSGGMTSEDLINGKIGKAIDFDGVNDYIAAPDSASLKPTDVTLSVWANFPDSSNFNGKWIGKASRDRWGNYDGLTYGFNVASTSGVVSIDNWFEYYNSLQQYRQDYSGITTDTWYHLVANFDEATDVINLYVNGNLILSSSSIDATVLYDYTTQNEFRMGGYRSGTGATWTVNAWVSCQIDEVRVSTTSRDSAWIAAEYNNMNSPNTFMGFDEEESSSSMPATVWRHDGSSWGTASSSQTTGSGSDGKNPQPNSDGAIRIREYSKNSSGANYYKYNIQVSSAGYSNYDYYLDYGGNYITSISSTESDGVDKCIGEDWQRDTIGEMNGSQPYDGLNEKPDHGSWYVGLSSDLAFSISSVSASLDLLSPDFTAMASTTLYATTSYSGGYTIRAYASYDGRLRLDDSNYISRWDYANSTPELWSSTCTASAECGFGYTTDDSNLGGETGDRFAASTKYAGFATSSPGDPVADSDEAVQGDAHVITYKTSVLSTQPAGVYNTVIYYICTANY